MILSTGISDNPKFDIAHGVQLNTVPRRSMKYTETISCFNFDFASGYLNYEPDKHEAFIQKIKNTSPDKPVLIGFHGLAHNEKLLETAYETLATLPQAKYLNVSSSSLTASILKLPFLEGLVINASSNDTDLPDYLADLPNLKLLSVSFYTGKLRKIPACVLKMPNLRVLQLEVKTCARQLPTLFEKSPHLEFLEILCPTVFSLPENILHLKKLQVVSFEKSKFNTLAKAFETLTQLAYLSFEVSLKNGAAKSYFQLPAQLTQLTLSEDDGEGLNFLRTAAKNILNIDCNATLNENSVAALTTFTNLERLAFDYNAGEQMWRKIFNALSQLTHFKHFECLKVGETFEGIEQIEQLETLKIRGEIKNLKTFGALSNLKKLSIDASSGIFVIPSSWNKLQNLTELALKFSLYGIDNLKTLTRLKSISFRYVEDNLEKTTSFLNNNLQLDSIEIYGGIENLQGLTNGENIKSLHLFVSDFKIAASQDISSLFTLKRLRLNVFQGQKPEFLPQFFKNLSTISTLRELYFENYNFALPIEFGLLRQLDVMQILYQNNKPLIELALLAKVKWVSRENAIAHSDEPLIEKLDKLKTYNLTDVQRIIVFGIITDNFLQLQKYVPNTLAQTLKPTNKMYLSGRMHGMTQAKTKELLAEKNIAVSNSLNESVTHVSVGEGLKIEEAVNIVTSGARLALSEYLTEFLSHPDDFYLLQEENNELTKQIIKLMLSEDEANHQLALQILEGGGAAKRILNYLIVFEGIHPNLNIRRDARKLFKRFASKALVEHVKDSKFWGFYNDDATKIIGRLFNHPDLNYWDGVIAYTPFRNNIIVERLKSPSKYTSAQPFTLSLNPETLKTLDQIPEELAHVKLTGITYHWYGSIDDSLNLLCQKINQFPQLKSNFYGIYGDITWAQYAQLKITFERVHLTTTFKIVE